MKKLTDLNPKFTGCLRPDSGEQMQFDCPACGPGHRLSAYFQNPIDGGEANGWTPKWERSGETFEELTITPSIDYGCFHGWVEDGRVIDISEAPLIVPGAFIGQPQATVALSPAQSEAVARQVLERVAALRGD